MKTIIAGSRTITDFSLVEQAITESGFEITKVRRSIWEFYIGWLSRGNFGMALRKFEKTA